MAAFDATDIRQEGFEGFFSVLALRAGLSSVPTSPGMYAVLRLTDEPPEFLRKSPASWYKREDPTVPLERLRNEWVEEAETLYIGQAKDLLERIGLLIEFSDAGPDKSVFHWGGRLLWQVAESDDFQVAWMATEPSECRPLERVLVDGFADAWGRMPFANLQRPAGR